MTNRGFHGGWFNNTIQAYHFGIREYFIHRGRWAQGDPNALGLHYSSIAHYHGMSPMLSSYVSSRGQYLDGLNRYGHARFNPNRFTDPMGYFSYGELLTTAGIQGAMGGMINGLVSKFAGGGFWEGFKSGALTGAMGGVAGYAFTAARAGFIGRVIVGNAVEGFVGDAAGAFYNGADFHDALVQGLYGAAMNVAGGGLFEVGAKSIKALGIADALQNADPRIPRRKNSNLPAYGPGSFRDQMVKAWGIDPPGYDAHHVFPLELAHLFRPTIEPDDIRFGAWWESGAHRRDSKAYEKAWLDFFKENPKPTFEGLIEKAKGLSNDFDYDWSFAHDR